VVTSPSFADVAVAAARRLVPFLPQRQLGELESARGRILEAAKATACGEWRGERLDLHRYSGRQKAELELRGVSGHLDLPGGPDGLYPLLAAAQWLHIGKATTVGLGKLVIEQLKE